MEGFYKHQDSKRFQMNLKVRAAYIKESSVKDSKKLQMSL